MLHNGTGRIKRLLPPPSVDGKEGTGPIASPIKEAIKSLHYIAIPTDDKLRATFRNIDKDGGGTVDKEEMTVALKALGKSEEVCKAMLARMPKDELDFDDFKMLMGVRQSFIHSMHRATYQ
jgi:Ca2+-binding EF-hand superfamily protein